MASNRNPHRGKEWREKIQTSVLVNRLQDNAIGTLTNQVTGKPTEMTQGQIASAKILLSKMIPDLKAIEMTGDVDVSIKSKLQDLTTEELKALASDKTE